MRMAAERSRESGPVFSQFGVFLKVIFLYPGDGRSNIVQDRPRGVPGGLSLLLFINKRVGKRR